MMSFMMNFGRFQHVADDESGWCGTCKHHKKFHRPPEECSSENYLRVCSGEPVPGVNLPNQGYHCACPVYADDGFEGYR